MDTKYMNELPQSIEKLLLSSIKEDIILGLIWCNKHMGKTWCLNNFIYREGITEGYKYSMKNCRNHTEAEILDFGDYQVILGNRSIEAYTDIRKYGNYGLKTIYSKDETS